MSDTARRDRARRAVMAVAERFSIPVDELEVIKDSNNTIVAVNDRVVAKVATTTLPGRATALDREFAVLEFLSGRNAPVVALSDAAPRAIHEAEGVRLLLLERLGVVDDAPDADAVVDAIDRAHAALRGIDGPLPSFTDTFAAARSVLSDATVTRALPDDDRRFVRHVAETLREWLAAASWDDIALHGDPWIGGNVVSTTSGIRLVDFEAACTGPREWDLSSLGPLANNAPGANAELLEWCGTLRSFIVAAWCWSQPTRAPEVAEAARWHLQLLRRRLH